MEFSDTKPIFRQIIEYCYLRILSGEWEVGGRIPSTKELAVTLAVNNRTVLKAYDEMHDLGVIYQKRGLGYFISAEANSLILAGRRREFMDVTLPEFIAQMRVLGLTSADILPCFRKGKDNFNAPSAKVVRIFVIVI